ncbi:MAG: hypothetical protein V1834_02345 [Candidatus Micrarchaeota archaeon]
MRFTWLVAALALFSLAAAHSVSVCNVPVVDGICCTNYPTVYLFPSGTGCCIGGMPYEQGSGLCGPLVVPTVTLTPTTQVSVTPPQTKGIYIHCPSEALLVFEDSVEITASVFDSTGKIECVAGVNEDFVSFEYQVLYEPLTVLDSGLVDAQYCTANGDFGFTLDLPDDLKQKARIDVTAYWNIDADGNGDPDFKDDCSFYAFYKPPSPTPDLHWLVIIMVALFALFLVSGKRKQAGLNKLRRTKH